MIRVVNPKVPLKVNIELAVGETCILLDAEGREKLCWFLSFADEALEDEPEELKELQDDQKYLEEIVKLIQEV